MRGFLAGRINPADKERDAKLLAFCSVVAFAIVKLGRLPLSDQWVNAFYGLCTLVGLGGPAFAAVEKWRGGNVKDEGAQ